jgi:TolB-like protein
MFADMVGYTRLMQENEHEAKRLRDRQRKVVDDQILMHNGQVMQYYGDGTLSMFGSAIEAVNAAKKIQLELQNDPSVPMRIGIHLGDVVYDDEGIYGDAVNIAARVQALGVPGSVMISEKIFDEIKNHPGLRVEAFGQHELKNVFQRTGIFALAHEGLQVPSQRHIEDITGSYENSVAVLPFLNMSSDPDNEYFSDGITEEIINSLVKVKGVEVASRTSVFAYKGANKDIRQIGKELNVSCVLEGSVRKSGNRIRVTSQLINTKDGFHRWSENFDREMKDIFEVQDEIARKIAGELEANFNSRSSEKLYEASTDSIVAYNNYLRGLFYWNKRTPESVRKAITFFEKAIDACSTYTNAFSAIAKCYTFLGATGQMPGKEAFEKAEQYAIQSSVLNHDRADSYAALGFVNLFFKWNLPEAEAQFRKAITLEPDHLDARIGLGYYYRATGDFNKMMHHLKAAVKLDPLSLPTKLELARGYSLVGKHNKAIGIYDEIIELDPLFRAAHEGKALAFTENHDYDSALIEAEKYLKQVDILHKGGTQLGYIAALKGDINVAMENLELLKKRQESDPDVNLTLDFALLYAALGDRENSFKYIQSAIEQRIGSVLFLTSMAPFEKLKDDPDFKALLKQIKPVA